MKKYALVLSTSLLCLATSASAAKQAAEPATHPTPAHATVYKSPACGCCTKWEDHLRANGFRVSSVVTSDVSRIKTARGIRPEHSSCHTALIGKYVIEGHVPADSIKRLLAQKPQDTIGLAVPGMPMGSPGMEGPYSERYRVLKLDTAGKASEFASY